MLTRAARNAHGPEYYRALLAQSEDEIIKPKRSTPVLEAIEYMRRDWRKCVPLRSTEIGIKSPERQDSSPRSRITHRLQSWGSLPKIGLGLVQDSWCRPRYLIHRDVPQLTAWVGYRFCQEILQTVDSIERLRTLSLRDLQVFFRWFLQKRRMRKVASLLSHIKVWSMMYRDDVGRSVEKEMIGKINTVR